jgi:hypothetical protein
MSPNSWVRIIFQIFALLFIFYNTLFLSLSLPLPLFLELNFLDNFKRNFYLFLYFIYMKVNFPRENSSYSSKQIRRNYFPVLFEFQ